MASTTYGSLAAEAASYLTNSAGAVGGFCGIQEEIGRQAGCLVEWSKKRGVFLTDSYTAGLNQYEVTTTEHVVFFGAGHQRVIKCTKPGKFGYGHGPKGKRGAHPNATPLFYLQRIELMNLVFATDLRLEGIALGRLDIGNNHELRPFMVTSQSYIERADKNQPHPPEEDIGRFMTQLGFKLIEDSCYNWFRESDGIIVTDTKQFNFILSPEGIVPIDLIVSEGMP